MYFLCMGIFIEAIDTQDFWTVMNSPQEPSTPLLNGSFILISNEFNERKEVDSMVYKLRRRIVLQYAIIAQSRSLLNRIFFFHTLFYFLYHEDASQLPDGEKDTSFALYKYIRSNTVSIAGTNGHFFHIQYANASLKKQKDSRSFIR